MKKATLDKDQPALLKAIELILASPAEIKRGVQKIIQQQDRTKKFRINGDDGRDKAADKLIASYSTRAGLSGGATALVGVIPGIGTAVEVFGGATADAALCLKFQVEMTMALAHLYGHDIDNESEKKRFFIVAGLSTLNTEAMRQGGEQAGKIFTKLVQRYLQETGRDTIRILFRKVGITLSKKALQKAIPFGIGAVIGFSSNKALTSMVGRKAKAYFANASPSWQSMN